MTQSHHFVSPWQQRPPPPACPMLMSTGKRQVATWRKRLQCFEEELYEYNVQHGLRHNPTLRSSVHPSVWSTISEQLLHPEDRSEMSAPPNHAAVEAYLRGTGPYEAIHGRPGEVYCADPLSAYRNLVWPDVSELSYVTAFDIYISRWRNFSQTLQEVDRLDEAELVPIMTAAIRPQWLQDTIVMKIATGKGHT